MGFPISGPLTLHSTTPHPHRLGQLMASAAFVASVRRKIYVYEQEN